MGTRLVVTTVGLSCKAFLHFLTRKVTLRNREAFLDTLYDPERKRPIITVANHASTFDDPLLWSVLPARMWWQPQYFRWALGAKEIVHINTFFEYFFTLGQTMPIVRGNGIYQPVMDFALRILNKGAWLHVFPEGKVNQGIDLPRLKWGVGRLILESTLDPIIIPIWHHGMEDIMPLDQPQPLPHLWKDLTVVFGDPLDVSDLVQAYRKGILSDSEARIAISSRIHTEMGVLKKQALQIHPGIPKVSDDTKFKKVESMEQVEG